MINSHTINCMQHTSSGSIPLATGDVLIASQNDAFIDCPKTEMIESNECESKTLVISCISDHPDFKDDNISSQNKVSRLLTLKNISQEQRNILNGTNITSELSHFAAVFGASTRLISSFADVITKEKQFWFDAFILSSDVETSVNVDGNTIDAKSCNPKTVNFSSNINCKNAVAKFVTENVNYENAQANNKLEKINKSIKVLNVKKLSKSSSAFSVGNSLIAPQMF